MNQSQGIAVSIAKIDEAWAILVSKNVQLFGGIGITHPLKAQCVDVRNNFLAKAYNLMYKEERFNILTEKGMIFKT